MSVRNALFTKLNNFGECGSNSNSISRPDKVGQSLFYEILLHFPYNESYFMSLADILKLRYRRTPVVQLWWESPIYVYCLISGLREMSWFLFSLVPHSYIAQLGMLEITSKLLAINDLCSVQFLPSITYKNLIKLWWIWPTMTDLN